MNCMRCGAEMKSTTGGNFTCPKCNFGINDLVYRPQNCDMPLPDGFNMQYGWICPKCGKVLAPWMNECDCYKKKSSSVTTLNDLTATNITSGTSSSTGYTTASSVFTRKY